MSTPAVRVLPIPYDQDNCAWLVQSEHNDALIIDPGNARAIEAVLAREHTNPAAFLCTHGHADHTSGLSALRARFPEAKIIAHPAYARSLPAGKTLAPCRNGEEFVFGEGEVRVRCLETPGHTADSICFYVAEHALFTGDTLFALGCGRVSGAAYEALFRSLASLAALPGETLVYPGHDYFTENLRFARGKAAASSLPDAQYREASAHAVQRLLQERADAYAGEPPSSLASERESNPFLRLAAEGGADAFEEFIRLRKQKNSFI
jgi:hydroxyacylglutathione hydrolase